MSKVLSSCKLENVDHASEVGAIRSSLLTVWLVHLSQKYDYYLGRLLFMAQLLLAYIASAFEVCLVIY